MGITDSGVDDRHHHVTGRALDIPSGLSTQVRTSQAAALACVMQAPECAVQIAGVVRPFARRKDVIRLGPLYLPAALVSRDDLFHLARAIELDHLDLRIRTLAEGPQARCDQQRA